MMALHSMPQAFSRGKCDRIIAAAAQIPTEEALLVGRNRDHNLRNAELVWMDDVGGMGDGPVDRDSR